ncbi:hypothetical protein sscle_03g028430 [Sclerotinia sclerotiorum 1980 UF-70]|uniref:Uncharacterized protein n=2 Tax=Sclerotinia sclerotiorum (strain ATCC 18683 / 1980 / Ss-1) TaxID=665079 RepID=A0A1D9Q0K3_SCLS1|nr:hypothetical protein sscle_03g028430 [Sclerotinia sclerotiorum 1980 UF-70]
MSGLRTSIWAPGNYRAPRSSGSSYNTLRENVPVSTHSHPSRETSKNRITETPRKMILDREPPQNELQKSSGGLSTSQWAPRDYPGRSKAANRGEVWTMITPTSQSSLVRHAYNASSPAHSSRDLGLPYEVQHYILGMMQRILEEGCYTFASRWIPDLLHKNNWTCSEAVELSTWRTFLPENIPAEALASHSKPLHRCLADAVRIRNSATHRHICSSRELQRMTQQAEDLMSLFSDQTRQLKFQRLWIEINGWENLSVIDMQAARHKMELALQEIGERPMDDMDWTANTISLQQIPPGKVELGDTDDYDVYDEMEID